MLPRSLLCLVVLALAPGCSDPAANPPPGVDVGADAPATADQGPGADLGADAVVPADAGAGGDAAGLTTDCPVKGYAPCGGDLLGAWSFVSLCPEDQAAADALFEHPYDDQAACQDRTTNFVIGKWIRSGSLTFDATTVAVKMTTSIQITYGFTDACLAAASPGSATPSAACTGMAASGKLTCAYKTGLCTCQGTVAAPDEDTSAPYQLSGGDTLTVGKDVATYCRSGKVLILDWLKHPISWRYWILQRS